MCGLCLLCFPFQSLLESTPEQLQAVVQTNLLGSLLCTKAALEVMKGQADGGHIFNIDGAGADGLPTPNYAAYGATKAGTPRFSSELVQSMSTSITHPAPHACLTLLRVMYHELARLCSIRWVACYQ